MLAPQTKVKRRKDNEGETESVHDDRCLEPDLEIEGEREIWGEERLSFSQTNEQGLMSAGVR